MNSLLATHVMKTVGTLLVLLVVANAALLTCTTSETPTAMSTVTPTATLVPTPTVTPTAALTDEAEVKKYVHQILATGEPGANEYDSSPPGQSTVLERGYPGPPPLIPHSISWLAITKDQNLCLTCRVSGASFGPGHTATKIPDSHYVDIPTGLRSEDIQALGHNCMLCHVPQCPETPPLTERHDQSDGR